MNSYSELSIPTGPVARPLATVLFHALENDLDRIAEEVTEKIAAGDATAEDMREALNVFKLIQVRERMRAVMAKADGA